jgi:hypothetical protein
LQTHYVGFVVTRLIFVIKSDGQNKLSILRKNKKICILGKFVSKPTQLAVFKHCVISLFGQERDNINYIMFNEKLKLQPKFVFIKFLY